MAPNTSVPSPPCTDHPTTPSRARCSSCNRPLCNDCFRFRLDDRPACARCAYELATRPQRRISLAIAFFTFCAVGGAWCTRRYGLWTSSPGAVVFGGLIAALIGILVVMTGKRGKETRIENRDPDDNPDVEEVVDASPSPYRAGVRRIIQAASPRVSGALTALVVCLSLVASAVAVPFSLHLPVWLEVELVVGAWWLIVSVTLIVMLYRGFQLRDDYVYFLPWNRPKEGAGGGGGGHVTSASTGRTKSSFLDGCGSGCSPFDGCGSVDGEGALIAIVVVVAAVVALGAAWLFVELAMPLVFFLMYSLLLRAISRVSRNNRECQGSVLRSVGWGALWAAIYVLPVGLCALVAHALKK